MFEQVVGNQNITQYLAQSIKSKNISHAYVFYGDPGIGKSMIATLFAHYLMCENVQQIPCGKCAGCKLSQKGNHPDLNLVDRSIESGFGVESAKRFKEDKAPKSISVDVIRKVKSDIEVKPFRAEKKVYLVFEADLMTVSAQNSFLKILEEPPSYTVIILVTNHAQSLLETVLSRCVTIGFNPPTPFEIELYLKEHVPKYKDHAKIAASLCGGSIKKALALLEDKKLLSQNADFLEIFQNIFQKNRTKLIDAYLFFEKSKDLFPIFIERLLLYVRDMILIKLNQRDIIINIDSIETLVYCAKNYSLKQLISAQEVFLGTKKKFDQNGNYSLLIADMLLKCGREDVYDRSSWSAV